MTHHKKKNSGMAQVQSSNPSSSSNSESSTLDDKKLLKFYQNKFTEYQRREDKYKEKIDKHLQDLITDRHELEEEVLRRGEKISDLQKALVELQLSVFEEREKFLKVSAENEELKRKEIELHENIRKLLSMTQQKDLRDQIIYILKDPKVEIGYRADFSSKSRLSDDQPVYKKLKTELHHLQRQLDDVLSISKGRSDVLLEDCKQALERSKEKIMHDEACIKELKKKIQKLEEERDLRQEEEESPRTSVKTLSVDSTHPKSSTSSAYLTEISSQLKDIYSSLNKLFKVISKTNTVLNSIRATRIYQKTSNIPHSPPSMDDYISESTVSLLEDYLRQCTRLSFDINNEHKKLIKYISRHKKNISNISVLKLEMKYFEDMLKEMTIGTAEADLLNVSLKRSDFFQVLKGHTSIFLDDKSALLQDFNKMIDIYDGLYNLAVNACDFVDKLIKKYDPTKEDSEIHHFSSTSVADSQKTSTSYEGAKSELSLKESAHKTTFKSSEDLENLLGIYKRTLQEAENLGFGSSAETKILSEKMHAAQKQLEKEKSAKLFEHFKTSSTCESATLEDLKSVKSRMHTAQKEHGKEESAKNIEHFEIRSEAAPSGTVKSVKSRMHTAQKEYGKEESAKDIEHFEIRSEAALSGTVKSVKSRMHTAQKQLENEEAIKNIEHFTIRSETIPARDIKSSKSRLQTAQLDKENAIRIEESTGFEFAPSTTKKSDDIVRKINKTLSKVKMLEQGEYFKDEELCRKLASNINALQNKFKEFTEEISLKSMKDQFSEYSSLTLSKLEELAKQSRNSVVAAEAQIASHRSNAKQLSQKLKDTEELLRESIRECLTLKQKVKQVQEQAEIDKINFISDVKKKLEKISDENDLQASIQDLVTHIVESNISPVIESKPLVGDAFVCIACRQGGGHKLCEEKIRDLRAEDRKSKTQLKLLQQEMKEQKMKLDHYYNVAEKASAELANKNKSVEGILKELKSKNASLLEQLKLEKNRMKNMERFRRFEIEGFQTDIKNLKTKIRDLEKQLMKAVLIFENNHKDMELLRTVHETAQRSKEATSAIRRLKAKLYELENDIKNL